MKEADSTAGSAVRQARLLAGFTLDASSVSTLGELLDALVEVADWVLAADSVHVGRIDRPRGRIQTLRNAGVLADWEIEYPVDETYVLADYPQLLCIAEQATAWRGGVNDDKTAENDRVLLASQGKTHGLGVPIMSPDGVWGELFVARAVSPPFSETDEHVATILAGLTSTGLVRILGDQRLQALAYADPLTGLANRRAADEQLEAWASHPDDAQRLTVVLCDVNGLKTVNDTHGHLIGDRLIREVAVHASAAAGRLPRGIAARIGGDEFLIASPCQDQHLVHEVLAELATTTANLPFGNGLSCGSAWAGELIRPEASPQSLVRSLLRMADSEQYRRKVNIRSGAQRPKSSACAEGHLTVRAWRDAHAPPPPPPPPPPSPADQLLASQSTQQPDSTRADVAHKALMQLLTDVDSGDSVKQRLEHAAQTVAQHAGAVAWWISSIDEAAGTIQALSCGKTRPDDAVTDGLWPPVEIDPNVYQVSDFPLTTRAARGEAFSVDTRTGDPAEQRLLIQLGYQSMIAAGGTDHTGVGWLIEIYGDSLTSNLRAMQETLRHATSLAITAE